MDNLDRLKKHVWKIAVLIGLLGACFAVIGCKMREKESPDEIQKGIAQEILRFHVLANSDSEEDQNLKLKVKTNVVNYLETVLPDSKSLNDTKVGIYERLDHIRKVAEDTISENGFSYPVSVKVTKTDFPQKTYGDCTFPAGEYEALQIKIGEAKGKNWWCVLYPSLCFVEETVAVVTQEKVEELKKLLTEDEFDTITDNPKFKIRFRWL